MLYPALNSLSMTREWTYHFYGLDRRPLAYNGAKGKGNSITPMTFDAMGNMSGEKWPLLSSRKKRGIVAEMDAPQALTALGKLAWIDGSTLYYDGQATTIDDLSTDPAMLSKRLVTMGAYLIVMPDKRYYNTANPEDAGSMERLYATEEGTIVKLTLCDLDGTEYPEDEFFISDRDPLDVYAEWEEEQEESQESGQSSDQGSGESQGISHSSGQGSGESESQTEQQEDTMSILPSRSMSCANRA